MSEIHPQDFRLLAAGQTLSWLGNGFQTVALAVAVILSGHGPGSLGVVMACSVVATVTGTLFGGVWADRIQPRTVMISSDLVRMAATAGMAAMFGLGHLSLVLLCVLAAATSGAGSFFNPAMTALRPMVTAPEDRQRANATLSLLQSGATIAGPAAGGVTVAALGATAGFAVNAGSFLASVIGVVLVRARANRTPRAGMLHEMREGWAEIRRHDWLLSGVLAATAYHVANGVVLVLIQVVVLRDLGGAGSAGFVTAAEGLGGALGAVVALRLRPHRLLRAGWSALLLMPLWVLVYVWPAQLAVVIAGAVVGYAGLIFFDVQWETAIQDHVPHRLLARVASWDTLTSFVAMPIGNVLAGPLSAALGIDEVLAGCAVVLFAAGAAPLAVAGTRHLVRTASPDAGPGLPPELAVVTQET